MAKTAGSLQADGGIKAGASGTLLTHIEKGEVTVDLASLAASTAADLDITITGAVAGDTVILQPKTADLTAGMLVCQAWVAAADTATVRVYNASAGTIDEASATWYYTLIRA